MARRQPQTCGCCPAVALIMLQRQAIALLCRKAEPAEKFFIIAACHCVPFVHLHF